RGGRFELELVATRRMLSVGNDGRTVVQASGGGRYAQWDIEDAGNGYYYVLAVGSGDAMTVSGRGESGDTVVLARLRRGDENQLWQIRPASDNGYSFITRRGKALDSPSSARYDGGRMQIYGSNGDANQRFLLRSVDNSGRDRDYRDRDSNRDRDYRDRNRDQGYGGYGQSGVLMWRGRVDDVTILEIRDRSVRDRVVSGQPAQRVDYNFSSALPRTETSVSVDKRRGRGEVRVVEQPSRRNGYTAVIEIRDSSGGASDYEIEVRWN
ncbi:MAG TPA: RICIN domain-containing protein, partial [Blastocatellia bacterium]|nr:RICIN domain-containing protein [Blastocatellia bacterium]